MHASRGGMALPLDDAIARCAEHFPDAEHDVIRELTANAYRHEEAQSLSDEAAREDPARLNLDGLPEALREPILMVLQASPGDHRVRLEALGESEAWRGASAPVRVDAVGRLLRRLRSDVSPDLLVATLGTMDRRSGAWHLPAAAAGVEADNLYGFQPLPELSVLGDVEPVARGLAWRGKVTLIHAKAGGGKTTLVAVAVAAVTTGRDFLDASTSRGPVVWMGVDDPGAETMFRQFGGDPRHWIGSRSMGVAKRLQAGLPRIVERFAPVLIVVDTLTSLCDAAGIDIDKSSAAESVVRPFASVAHDADGPAVILLHHEPRNEDRARNSSALDAAVDVILGIEVDLPLRLTTVRAGAKVRAGIPAEELRCHLGPDGYSVTDAHSTTQTTGAKVVDDPAAPAVRRPTERILIHLSRMDRAMRLAKRDCAKALGYLGSSTYRSTFEPAMFELIDHGLIDLVDGKGGRNTKGKVGLALTAEGRKSADSLKPLTAPAPIGVADRVNGFEMPENIGPKTVDGSVNGFSASTVSGGAKVDDSESTKMNESDAAFLRVMIADPAQPIGGRDEAPAPIRLLLDQRTAGEKLTEEEVDVLAGWVSDRADELIASGEVTEADGEDYARDVANGKREIVTSYSPPEGAAPHRPTCPEDAQAWLRLHGVYVEGRGPVETDPDCEIGKDGARLFRRDNALILEDPLGAMHVGPRALRWAGMPDEMIAALAQGCELGRGAFGEWRDVDDPSRQYGPVRDEAIQ